MTKCKITVKKKTLNADLAKAYCKNEITTCPEFTEGQEFVTGYEKPSGFCDWAWHDINRYVVAILTGGNFSSGIFEDWMKDESAMIGCCTDGIRPVIFKIEKYIEPNTSQQATGN